MVLLRGIRRHHLLVMLLLLLLTQRIIHSRMSLTLTLASSSIGGIMERAASVAIVILCYVHVCMHILTIPIHSRVHAAHVHLSSTTSTTTIHQLHRTHLLLMHHLNLHLSLLQCQLLLLMMQGQLLLTHYGGHTHQGTLCRRQTGSRYRSRWED